MFKIIKENENSDFSKLNGKLFNFRLESPYTFNGSYAVSDINENLLSISRTRDDVNIKWNKLKRLYAKSANEEEINALKEDIIEGIKSMMNNLNDELDKNSKCYNEAHTPGDKRYFSLRYEKLSNAIFNCEDALKRVENL